MADRYTLERELGAGGMATVYLAHDPRHNRKSRHQASRSRSGGSALARGPDEEGPLKGLFNARMNPRGVIQPPDLFTSWPSPSLSILERSGFNLRHFAVSRYT